MPTHFNGERIAEGRTRITLTLPERLIGELDVEVAKQKIVGNWLRRNDAIDRALSEFLHDGGLAGVDRAAQHAALAGRRRHMTTHLDVELMATVKQQILEQRATGSRWSTWEVVALAVQQFLDAGAFDQPSEDPASRAALSQGVPPV